MVRLAAVSPTIAHVDRLLDVLMKRADIDRLATFEDSREWYADGAANSLLLLLMKLGHANELERRAAAHDEHPAERLAWMRVEQMSELEPRAAWETDDPHGSAAYAELLYAGREVAGLTELAEARERRSDLARWRLVELLYQIGDRVAYRRDPKKGTRKPTANWPSSSLSPETRRNSLAVPLLARFRPRFRIIS
jgi:hypothetical protein